MASKELQEKYMMLQLIDAQIQEIEKEVAAIENRNAELVKLKDNLGSLNMAKKGNKNYSPLGLGIYIENELSNAKEVLVNVGSNIFVKKDMESAQVLLDNQLKQTGEVAQQLAQNMQILAERAYEVEHEIQDLGAK